MDKNIAGVVLAGGRSSRMGQDKAMLDYNDKPLLEHMVTLLKQTGVNDVYVSGDFEGYNCVPDSAPHEGPARAMCDVLMSLKMYDGVLFVPVDMPFLTPEILSILLLLPNSAFFKDHPLPAFVKPSHLGVKASSVRDLLKKRNAASIFLPQAFEVCMLNVNTPEEWKKVLHA